MRSDRTKESDWRLKPSVPVTLSVLKGILVKL